MPLRFAAFAAAAVLAALIAPSPAGAAVGDVPVRQLDGTLLAAAFSGDAVVLVRQPERGSGVRVERHAPGQPPAVLLRTRGSRFRGAALIAASPQAIAVSLYGGHGRADPARVLVGPPTGPLRDVAGCRDAFLAPPVAVEATRVAWSEGTCMVRAGPREIEPGAVVVADVDPAVPARRIAVPEERVPTSLSVAGDAVVAGLLRPSLLAYYGGELRRAEGDAFGPPLAGGAGTFADPVGVLPGGVTVAVRNRLLERLVDEDRPSCPIDLITVAAPAAGDARGRLRLGGCLAPVDAFDEDGTLFGVPSTGSAFAVATADRVVARTSTRRSQRAYDYFDSSPELVNLVSAAADGSDRRLVARGGRHRGPRQLIGGSGRVGWVQQRCAGGEEIRALDPFAPAGESKRIPACRAYLLTRRARLRGGAIRLRLRCPRGCKGRVVDRSVCLGETSQAFRFGRGVHVVRLRVTKRARRVGRAVLRVRDEGGPEGRRTVRVVRRAA